MQKCEVNTARTRSLRSTSPHVFGRPFLPDRLKMAVVCSRCCSRQAVDRPHYMRSHRRNWSRDCRSVPNNTREELPSSCKQRYWLVVRRGRYCTLLMFCQKPPNRHRAGNHGFRSVGILVSLLGNLAKVLSLGEQYLTAVIFNFA